MCAASLIFISVIRINAKERSIKSINNWYKIIVYEIYLKTCFSVRKNLFQINKLLIIFFNFIIVNRIEYQFVFLLRKTLHLLVDWLLIFNILMIMSDDGAEMFSNHSNLRIIQRVQDEFDDQIEDEYDEEIEASNRINRKRPLGFESIERPLKKSRTQNETFFDINDDSEEKLGNESEEDDDNGINDEEIEYNDDDNDAESNDEQFDNGLTESEIDLNTQKVQKNSKVYEESRREKFSQNSNHHSHSMRKLNDNNNNNFEAERKTKIIDNNNTTSDKNKMEIRFLVSSRVS